MAQAEHSISDLLAIGARAAEAAGRGSDDRSQRSASFCRLMRAKQLLNKKKSGAADEELEFRAQVCSTNEGSGVVRRDRIFEIVFEIT